MSTHLPRLLLYALFAYICGFSRRNDLLFYIEIVWKEKRNQLIQNGINNAKLLALSREEIINNLDEENYGIRPSNLILVCLFNE